MNLFIVKAMFKFLFIINFYFVFASYSFNISNSGTFVMLDLSILSGKIHIKSDSILESSITFDK